MINEIFQLAISNGLWAVLFVFLFFYQIKDSNKREQKYEKLITELSLDVAIIKKVDTKVETINNNVLSVKKLFQKRGV